MADKSVLYVVTVTDIADRATMKTKTRSDFTVFTAFAVLPLRSAHQSLPDQAIYYTRHQR